MSVCGYEVVICRRHDGKPRRGNGGDSGSRSRESVDPGPEQQTVWREKAKVLQATLLGALRSMRNHTTGTSERFEED